MTTRLNDLIPMLICEDVPQSLAFYIDLLGFEVVEHSPAVGKSGFASIRQAGVRLMLASPGYFPEPVKVDGKYPQLVLYFYPQDVIALHRRLRDAGYEPSQLEDRFYGMREFELVDPSGHLLMFGQSIDSAERKSRG